MSNLDNCIICGSDTPYALVQAGGPIVAVCSETCSQKYLRPTRDRVAVLPGGPIMSGVKKKIAQTVSDMTSDFLYYKREEDDYLPLGAIEKAVKQGVVSIDDICAMFRFELESGIK